MASTPVPSSVPEVATRDDNARPVFVAGIMPRSGTNYLHRLLTLHPHCAPVAHEPVKEDFLLRYSHLLTDYANRLAWHWGHWGEAGPVRDELLSALEQGLTHFLTPAHPAPLVITKTPNVHNVGTLFDHFRTARLILLVRDGRSVVASGMHGFDWAFESAAQNWAEAAREVLTFRDAYGDHSERHLLVRYEDLNADPESVLTRIFQFLDLSPNEFDFEDALNLPVYGSSFTDDDTDDVSWTPQDKPDSFDSQERWADWSDAQHARFNWIAEDELVRLGYTPRSIPLHTHDRVAHPLRDARYEAARLPGQLRKALRAGLTAFRRAFRSPA